MKTKFSGTAAKRTNEFVRRGTLAIEETKRTSAGIPADVVIARLEVKLAAAREAKLKRLQRSDGLN